jgi:2-hydroxy-6-oxonona-2,4-dienedioate hydrolase
MAIMEAAAEAPTRESTIWLDLLGAQTYFVGAGDIRTRIIEAGSGPALVLLHGGGGHAEAFARNVVPLAQQGLRVVALDYLGHGLTDRPSSGIGRDDYVAHLVATLDALGIERAVLAGESLGGWISFWTALMHPDRVSKLISVCGARLEVERDPDSDAHVKAGRARFKALNQAFLDNPSLENVRNRLAWLFYRPEESITEELAQLRLRLYHNAKVQQTLSDGLGIKDRQGDPEKAAQNQDFDAETLGRIDHETLVLWTSHNPSNTAATARRAASHIPGARFTLMQDCGHWPQWEDPDTFNRLVSDFSLGRAAVGEPVPTTS